MSTEVSPPNPENLPAEATALAQTNEAMLNGALDTLTRLIRITGEASFSLGCEQDAEAFPKLCADFARHVENGSAVPAYDITPDTQGERSWSVVQRTLVERRRQEKSFVTERIGGYRDIVNELVTGFRQISHRDHDTESNIRDCLQSLQAAVGKDELPEVQTAIAQTMSTMDEILAEQRSRYETQLKQLNSRMLNLRQDLVTAREEMKRDALTQAFNRGAFDGAITQSLNMHYISGQPLTLLMIDIDNFKAINDQYGHGAGDAILRAFGDCLGRSFIRKSDLVARYGGDEFAVILSDTAGKNVIALAERFLNRVRDISVTVNDAVVTVTCSVGFTEANESDTVETFIQRADQALFQAKAQGRDCSAYLLPE